MFSHRSHIFPSAFLERLSSHCLHSVTQAAVDGVGRRAVAELAWENQGDGSALEPESLKQSGVGMLMEEVEKVEKEKEEGEEVGEEEVGKERKMEEERGDDTTKNEEAICSLLLSNNTTTPPRPSRAPRLFREVNKLISGSMQPPENRGNKKKGKREEKVDAGEKEEEKLKKLKIEKKREGRRAIEKLWEKLLKKSRKNRKK